MAPVTYSLVIPVYCNEGSIPDLVAAVRELDAALGRHLEAVFVVDGSPDMSSQLLSEMLPNAGFEAQVLHLSRNFGSFAAIRVGLEAASGDFFAVMAADLQEPPALSLQFFRVLETEPVDVVIGTRQGREDPFFTRVASDLFWWLYKYYVVPDMPTGGVDVFGCNRSFRDQLLRLEERHSSLVAMLFWLGFRRKVVSYERLRRRHGKSAWTLRKKLRYLSDSIFAFTDLPNRLLLWTGALGLVVSVVLGVLTVVARFAGLIPVSGYAATVLVIVFFAALNLLGLGIVGSYAWRAYDNTKGRPLAITLRAVSYPRTAFAESKKQ
jgi:glycosyltransferase involved in cell wall biosynthesis